MTDLQQMSRILYQHDWVNVEDWAANVARLADLDDHEITQLVRCDRSSEIPPPEHQNGGTGSRSSLRTRMQHAATLVMAAFRPSCRRAC